MPSRRLARSSATAPANPVEGAASRAGAPPSCFAARSFALSVLAALPPDCAFGSATPTRELRPRPRFRGKRKRRELTIAVDTQQRESLLRILRHRFGMAQARQRDDGAAIDHMTRREDVSRRTHHQARGVVHLELGLRHFQHRRMLAREWNEGAPGRANDLRHDAVHRLVVEHREAAHLAVLIFRARVEFLQPLQPVITKVSPRNWLVSTLRSGSCLYWLKTTASEASGSAMRKVSTTASPCSELQRLPELVLHPLRQELAGNPMRAPLCSSSITRPAHGRRAPSSRPRPAPPAPSD